MAQANVFSSATAYMWSFYQHDRGRESDFYPNYAQETVKESNNSDIHIAKFLLRNTLSTLKTIKLDVLLQRT